MKLTKVNPYLAQMDEERGANCDYFYPAPNHWRCTSDMHLLHSQYLAQSRVNVHRIAGVKLIRVQFEDDFMT